MSPGYLAIGHISKDLLDGGRVAPGGTVTYSALTAQKLGLQAAVVTSCAPGDRYLLDVLGDEGVWAHVKPSSETTTFRNTYDSLGRRTQVLSAQASPIGYDDVPEEWLTAPIVHLGPIAQELAGRMPLLFPGCLLGITPQGWMRSWKADGRVEHSALPVAEALTALPPHALLVLSMEDLGHDASLAGLYSRLAPLVVITQGAGDALVYAEGEPVASVPACRAQSVDPTGAGDVFATALLTRYSETHDPLEATRFAHAVAAQAIAGEGASTIPRREKIQD